MSINLFNSKYYFILSIIVIVLMLPLIYIYYFNKHDILIKRPNTIGIVFGASILDNKTPSSILRLRIEQAISLYKKKLIQKIVFSGSVRGQIIPGEPLVMQKYALKKGVPIEDIILDSTGENTYLTVLFARNFSIDHPKTNLIFISSAFHIPRIKLLAHMLNIQNFQTSYPNTKILFNKFIFRETIALIAYASYYPFYKMDSL